MKPLSVNNFDISLIGPYKYLSERDPQVNTAEQLQSHPLVKTLITNQVHQRVNRARLISSIVMYS